MGFGVVPGHDGTERRWARRVHRTLLKAVVGAGSAQGMSALPSPPPSQPQSEEELSDCELYLRQDALPATATHTDATRVASPSQLPQSANPPSVSMASPTTLTARFPPAHVAPPATSTYPGEGSVRRTTRSTAGQHANVHHLPRPVGGPTLDATNLPLPASNAVSALFSLSLFV